MNPRRIKKVPVRGRDGNFVLVYYDILCIMNGKIGPEDKLYQCVIWMLETFGVHMGMTYTHCYNYVKKTFKKIYPRQAYRHMLRQYAKKYSYIDAMDLQYAADEENIAIATEESLRKAEEDGFFEKLAAYRTNGGGRFIEEMEEVEPPIEEDLDTAGV